MKNKLIADAGSSKTDWALIAPDGSVRKFTTGGINALLASDEQLIALFSQVRSFIGEDTPIGEIFFYGAGCATPSICSRTEGILTDVFQGDSAMAASDLLGAARAVLGNARGIVCILGTGSNSCLYDGMAIADQIPSLGFILGDEGSGAALGKRLVTDIFKKNLPDSVIENFFKQYPLSIQDILEKVYRQPAPNRFLASFAPFLYENLWNPYIYSLVLKELTRFIQRNAAKYKDAHSLPVCFVGSIAVNFSKILNEAAESQGLSVGKIVKSPIEGLIEFHI